MALSAAQVRGRIKNVAKSNNADARNLMRIYAMDRFLERVSNSKYVDNIVIKGGLLVTAMIGISLRSTMDIDASIRNANLSAIEAEKIVSEIKDIDLDDGMTFRINKVEDIMDEMEYPGVRIHMDAILEKMVIPVKIDISTGDVITPRAVQFQYPLLLEDRSIPLWSYNLETVLSEKLQTILARGVLNTRMRDFYDIHALLDGYRKKVDEDNVKKAFTATCAKRGTEKLPEQTEDILERIRNNARMKELWDDYRGKYTYAADLTFEEVLQSAEELSRMIVNPKPME
jgi:predicted nucleotidyltransferase component of viral defense system